MDRTVKAETNGLAIASLIFGILSVLSCWTIILPIPQAALAIGLALLSRGNKKKCTMASTGLILGIVGAVLGVLFASVVVSWIITMLQNSSSVWQFIRMIYQNLQMLIWRGGF